MMRKDELEFWREVGRRKQAWEMKAHLMSYMLNALGVSVDDIMEANKATVSDMLLNKDVYIGRANPLWKLEQNKARKYPIRKG